MRKTKATVVGAGIYGHHHINAYLNNPDVELVAICDSNEKRCKAVAGELSLPGYSDLKTLLEKEDIDVVSVATSDPYHKDPALIAIGYGKHVLIEKPLATSVADAQAILDAMQKSPAIVGVDFHKRWDPSIVRVKMEVDKAETGRIIRGYISMDDVIAVPTEWLNWSAKSSPVWFLGSHCFDLIRYISGREVTSVYAVGQKRLLSGKGIDTWDNIQSVLQMDDGSSWVVENNWVLPAAFPKDNDGRVAIVCDNAYIRSDSQNRGLEIFGQDRVKTPNSYFITYRNNVASGFGIDPIHDFVRSVRHQTPYLATALDGFKVTNICEAVHRSLASGKPEKV